MKKEIEIEKCPICDISPMLEADDDEQGQRFRFGCKKCGLHGDVGSSYEEAASNWNRMLANSDKITKRKLMKYAIQFVVDVISVVIGMMIVFYWLKY